MKYLVIIAFTLCLLPVGCGRSADPSIETLLCDDLVALQTSLQPLLSVTPNTPPDDVRRTMVKIESDWRNLTLVGRDLQGIRINEWRSVYNQLNEAVRRLPDSSPLDNETENIVEEAREFNLLVEDAYFELKCR